MALLSLDEAANYGSGFSGTNGYQAQARLTQEVGQLAPLATSYHVQQPNMPVDYGQAPHVAGLGLLPGLEHFLGGIAGTIGHTASAVGKWLGAQVVNMAEAPIKLGAGISMGWQDRVSIAEVNAQSTSLNATLNTLHNLYKSGRISGSQYKLGLDNINQEFRNLSATATGLDNKVALDQAQTEKAVVDTAATLVTILTAGFGKAASAAVTSDGLVPLADKTAVQWVKTKAVGQPFDAVEQSINKLALDASTFNKLNPVAQQAIQHSTAEVLANSTVRMTAGEISQATAINLAIKYPVYFNYLSVTGEKIYHDMAASDTNSALKTIGFNAALLLSGGPIGYALKWGGAAASSARAALFGKTAFWDELSKFYGTGEANGFRTAVDQIKAAVDNPGANQDFIKSLTPQAQAHLAEFTPETFQDFVKNLSAAEATNMNAVGRHEAVAAANRVVTGMVNQRGFDDLSHISHAEGLLDMSRMSKWQRVADEAGRLSGNGPLTVGVADMRSYGYIADTIAPGRTVTEREKAWEDLKTQKASYSWANNPNVDRQMKNIVRIRNQADRRAAILDINGGKTVAGVMTNKQYAQMAKEGFNLIKPTNLEAPFKEGTGKISTQFADNNQFFIKASQPLPVLKNMGEALTWIGLSPEASQQQVYQVLNENFAKNLESLPVAQRLIAKLSNNGEKKMTGNITDYILKKLQQTKTKMPIRDYRMYNTRQIQEALDVSKSEAVDIQNAIAHSFIQTPMAIRGLGDRIVDLTYATRPTRAVASRFSKIQGTFRFAWNPFFTMGRLPVKTEALTEAEGGGIVRSIFTGRWDQIGRIRTELHSTGAFDKSGNFGVISGEAADMSGTLSNLGRDVTPLREAGSGAPTEIKANLAKKLTPTQERSIAGLIDSQATRMGLDWKTYINQFPDEVRNTVQMIAEYDKKSNFINSPLARTLNIAFFPFRFDIKVATIFARNLGKTDLLTQVAVINGLMRANQWMSSAEGKAWYQQNADAIGLFKYLTPVASLNEVMKSLLPGHDHHLGNFGELGGLPFGWIPQLTDGAGWTQFNAPGVNAKTGQPFPKYVPDSLKGDLSLAIQDLVGALYSYPGATLGLPSKGSVNRTIGNALANAHKSDSKLVTPLGVDPATLPKPPVSGQPGASVPSLPTSATVPRPPKPSTSRSGSGSSKTPKKKKAEYTPALLPGQTVLGQL